MSIYNLRDMIYKQLDINHKIIDLTINRLTNKVNIKNMKDINDYISSSKLYSDKNLLILNNIMTADINLLKQYLDDVCSWQKDIYYKSKEVLEKCLGDSKKLEEFYMKVSSLDIEDIDEIDDILDEYDDDFDIDEDLDDEDEFEEDDDFEEEDEIEEDVLDYAIYNSHNKKNSLLDGMFGKKKKSIFSEKDMDRYGLEEWQRKEVRKGNYNPWNFQEEDLEEDDYYYEDDEE